RGLERRPVLFLVGREPQARLQCGDARIGESRVIFLRRRRARASLITLLRINKRTAGDGECCRSDNDRFPHGRSPKNRYRVRPTIGAMMAPADKVMPHPESGKLKFGKLATVIFLMSRQSG